MMGAIIHSIAVCTELSLDNSTQDGSDNGGIPIDSSTRIDGCGVVRPFRHGARTVSSRTKDFAAASNFCENN
eukprot:68473-Pleurochrysis_carterae.AAC.3